MLKSWYFTVLPSILFIGATLGVAVKRSQGPEFIVLPLTLFAISLLSRIIYTRKRKFTYFYYIMCCISLSFTVLISWTDGPSDLPSFIPKLIVELLIATSIPLTYILFLIAVPTAIIPYFRGQRKSEIIEMDLPFDLGFIAAGFENIRQNFQGVQKAISSETLNIDRAISRFQENLQSQSNEFKRLQNELVRTKEELEEYRTLASLTKQQRDTLLAALSRQKYVDYLVGFILGVASSALVQFFPNIVKLLQ
jgi:hypothetical protein